MRRYNVGTQELVPHHLSSDVHVLLNLVVPCSACVGGLRDDPLKSILGRYKEGGRR